MELVINGQKREFAALTTSSTLLDLLVSLGLKSDRVAIEQNGAIVARSLWSSTSIQSGDRMEIVHFVGGGSPQFGLEVCGTADPGIETSAEEPGVRT
jgi:thiamine biosynthesis protein ThiS